MEEVNEQSDDSVLEWSSVMLRVKAGRPLKWLFGAAAMI